MKKFDTKQGFYGQINGHNPAKKKGVSAMARHGENIRKRVDGRWEGRYGVHRDNKKVYVSVYGRTYEEVKKKLITQKSLPRESKQGTNQDISLKRQSKIRMLPFGAVAEKWLLEIKAAKKLSTYVKYSVIYHHHHHLQQSFQNILLSEITPALVREKISDHLSDSLQKSIYCVLNQILKFASRQYSISVPDIKKPVSGTRKKPIEVLTRKEQARLLSVLSIKKDVFKTAVLLCMYTGLRLGELCDLKWSDVDLNNRILTINRTVQRLYVEGHSTKTILMEDSPKSEYSHREIPLSGPVLDLLSGFQRKGKYIFGGNKPLEPRTLQNHFKKILKEAGLPDKNFHILRHTFATNCIEGGADVKSLSEMLGHSNVQITLNRYVHPSMDTKRKHLDILSVFYGQAC